MAWSAICHGLIRRPASAVLLAALLTGASTTTRAADCGRATTQTAMNLCAADNYSQASGALDAVHAELMRKQDPAGRDSLQTAQQAWRSYRDAECAFETEGTAGGSANPMARDLCRQALTEERTRRLKAQLDCPEGDLSCAR